MVVLARACPSWISMMRKLLFPGHTADKPMWSRVKSCCSSPAREIQHPAQISVTFPYCRKKVDSNTYLLCVSVCVHVCVCLTLNSFCFQIHIVPPIFKTLKDEMHGLQRLLTHRRSTEWFENLSYSTAGEPWDIVLRKYICEDNFPPRAETHTHTHIIG